MIVYVGYILSDYATALWMSTEKSTVQKAIDEYHKRGGCCSTWIQKYNINKGLIEFECS